MSETVELKSLLAEELKDQNKWMPTLQDVANWSVQFGNFAELIDQITESGGMITITPPLLQQFVRLTNKRYGAAVAMIVAEYVKQGKNTTVEIDRHSSNLPVELEILKSNESLLTIKDNMN